MINFIVNFYPITESVFMILNKNNQEYAEKVMLIMKNARICSILLIFALYIKTEKKY